MHSNNAPKHRDVTEFINAALAGVKLTAEAALALEAEQIGEAVRERLRKTTQLLSDPSIVLGDYRRLINAGRIAVRSETSRPALLNSGADMVEALASATVSLQSDAGTQAA